MLCEQNKFNRKSIEGDIHRERFSSETHIQFLIIIMFESEIRGFDTFSNFVFFFQCEEITE